MQIGFNKAHSVLVNWMHLKKSKWNYKDKINSCALTIKVLR